MHLRLSCFQCGPGLLAHPVTVEVQDGPVYRMTCPAGHHTVHHLNNPKFEILFEMGLLAFNDGYTREAVATFAASAEEFFRLFINLVLMKHEFDRNPRWYQMKPFWKLADRAEPQIGAFAALHMIEKGCAPSYPDKKSIEFRNAVIHRGKIPSAAEVVGYGQKLLSFVVPICREYRNSTAFMLAGNYRLLEEIQTAKERMNASSYYVSAIRRMLDSAEEPKFEAAVELARNESFLRTTAT